MELINKSALVAEIERRMKLRKDSYDRHNTVSDFVAWEELEYFKEEFLPTLEVKEVDLTWQDIQCIAEIGNDFMNSEESDDLNEEGYYTGILKRFLEKKGGES